MGFTLAAVLKTVPASAEVIVAELLPAVVEWSRGLPGQCAGRPVDNGPQAMTHSANEWLYSPAGLKQK
jgi:spermidine synthase